MHRATVWITRILCVGIAGLIAACAPDQPMQPPPAAVGEAEYQRAELMLGPNTAPLLAGHIAAHYWQDNDLLVYRRSDLGAQSYVLFDPASGERSELIDTGRLAAALADLLEREVDSRELTLTGISLTDDGGEMQFNFEGRRYSLAPAGEYAPRQLERDPPGEFLSPDGSRAAFIREHNLWLRDTATGELTQLTFDGEENYGYATDNAGWIRGDGPVLKWSPDSNKIATFRHDGREVGDFVLWDTRVGRSEVDIWKYPLPGDEHIFMIERLVIHLEPEPRVVFLDMPPDPHRSTTSDHVAGDGGVFLDTQWSADSERLAFITSSRDHKIAQLRLADIEDGSVRDVYREEAATHYMAGFIDENWRVLHDRGEFIWFSEQDGWGHLYLHDLASGELKNRITEGSWLVLDIQQMDPEAGWIWLLASNIEGRDPYFYNLYRVGLNGGGLELLTPEPLHHDISWSASGEYFLDTMSTAETPPVSVVRNRDGAEIATLESTDITELLLAEWQPPVPFSVKARDGVTDLHGLMYVPAMLDPMESYPVLNYLYPGPLGSSVGSRRFLSSRSDKQALAELGFVVVEVDAMGTPGRSKSFHDVYYGDMGDNGLPDQVLTIRQLAERHPWIDLDRVGIWGHSGGGFASTAGILRYPDFYKVAVSSAGNHDNRNYEDDWAERWQGLLEYSGETDPVRGYSLSNYDNQSNPLLAGDLQGKLLLAHGLMDTNVHPNSTMLLVEALIEAEKDFDLIVLPNTGHGFLNSRWFMKRRWDYFIEHLQQRRPNGEFRFGDNIR
ncbi:MAG: prolyl oligopeptidase family serine peptidase [Gammaproteobacteria bacterium]|nr:prolyl oligopeptidase family serine peptidase [Gammaproteobacteria bacterium]